MALDDPHFEPFVHLAGLDDDQALIAWGGFWFRRPTDGHGWQIVNDEQLDEVDPGRRESMGLVSEPYGDALVEVLDADGHVVGSASTDEGNHVWVRDLEGDTAYTYRITVDGRPWAAEDLWSWRQLEGNRGDLVPADRRYRMAFRTFPSPRRPADLRAVVLGDYGVGIHRTDDRGSSQLQIAQAMVRLADRSRLDMLLTVGDNIYQREEADLGGTGSADDDWYWSYYEPYRFLIDRIPVYPAVGNHDSAETEDSDDRDQLDDNHYMDLRFRPLVARGRASVDPGLFYRLPFGRDIELVCIDTSEAGDLAADRFFTSPRHQPFLDETFASDRSDLGIGRSGREGWLIPFGHHPALCAGPSHRNDADLLAHMVPRYREAGVRLILAGHEHNFQHALHDDIHHIITGAGGKLRDDKPHGFIAAHTVSWAAQTHFLLLEVTADAASMWPVGDVGEDGELRCIDVQRTDGEAVELPIVVRR